MLSRKVVGVQRCRQLLRDATGAPDRENAQPPAVQPHLDLAPAFGRRDVGDEGAHRAGHATEVDVAVDRLAAILQAFALPVLTAAGFMLLFERTLGMSFFTPGGLVINNSPPTVGGGQALLWQHLFWFYSHPAVYIMILPAMGMVSDMIS